MPIRRTYTNIFQDGKNRLRKNSPINNFNSQGITKAYLDILAVELEKIYDQLDFIYGSIDPTINVGQDLDKVAFLAKEQRDRAATASDYSTTNFYFYIDPRLQWSARALIEKNYTPQEIDVLENAGYVTVSNGIVTQINIPISTTIYNADKSISYTTIEGTTLTGNSNAFAGIIATGEGPDFNVSSNTLITHSLFEIPELRKIAAFIKCTNIFPIQNGKYTQTDNEFRYRVSTAAAAIRTNELAIRRAALSVPGIRDIFYEKNKFGNGTVNIIVDGISPLISQGLIDAVKERTQQEASYGDTIFVQAPKYVGVELNFSISFKPGIIDENTVRNQVRDRIIQYINDLPLGSEIIWNQIVSTAIAVPGVEDFIPNIFKVGEYDALTKVNKRQIVLRFTNQKARYNEKFYTDSGLIACCA